MKYLVTSLFTFLLGFYLKDSFIGIRSNCDVTRYGYTYTTISFAKRNTPVFQCYNSNQRVEIVTDWNVILGTVKALGL